MKGIGCDIIEIDRVGEVLKRHPESFLNKTFTPTEQAYCLGRNPPERHFAGRFAAKEAIAKALGCGFGKDLSFLDIEVSNDILGKPMATLSDKAKDHFGHPEILLSISHCKLYANAVALIQ